ncbi:unnamed protein product, partial [Amoebophrya sp. A25]
AKQKWPTLYEKEYLGKTEPSPPNDEEQKGSAVARPGWTLWERERRDKILKEKLEDANAGDYIHYLIDEEKTIMGVKFYGTSWKPWWDGSLCSPFDERKKYGCEIHDDNGGWSSIRDKR